MSFILRAAAILMVCRIAAPAVDSAPILTYLTYFGRINAIATDTAGNVYVAGSTSSSRFPLVNALRSQPGEGSCSGYPTTFTPCGDAFVAKLDPTGTRLLFSTYLAGFGRDQATAIALDPDGNVYVAGITDSGDFPGSDPPVKKRVPVRAFAVKISASGEFVYGRLFPVATQVDPLLFFPLLQPTAAIAVDPAGNALIAGATSTPDFPTANALQPRPLHPLYVTTDHGLSWRTLSFADPVTTVFALAIDPRRPATLYAATDLGLYRSTDNGASWTLLYRAAYAASITAVILDPANPATLYIALAPASPAPASQPNLLKSTDAGATFRSIVTGIAPNSFGWVPEIAALAIDPAVSGRLWAAVSSDLGSTIYRSTDAGEHWAPPASIIEPLPTQLPGLSSHISPILVDPTQPGRLYAWASFRGSSLSLLRSEDAGINWTRLPAPEGANAPGTLDPRHGSVLYAPASFGLARSRDAGATWQSIPVPPIYLHDLLMNAAVGPDGNLYLLNSTGLLLRSTDDGATWTASNGPWTRSTRDAKVLAFADSATFYLSSPSSFDNAFAAKLDPTGRVLWSTLLGGSAYDAATAAAFDAAGNAWVAGATASKDFPVVAPFQPNLAGGLDVFLTKISADGSRILYSTYLGGSGDDTPNAIAADAQSVYLAGAAGPSFPVNNALRSAADALSSGFVAKLDASGQRLMFSTYLDGSGTISGIAVGPDGAAHLSGCGGAGLPLVSPLDTNLTGGFVASLNPLGTAIEFATPFFGCWFNDHPEKGPVLALAPSGSLWLAGPPSDRISKLGPDFSADPEGYLARIDFAPAQVGFPRIRSVRNAAGFQLGEVFAPGSLAAIFGDNLPRDLNGVTLSIAGIPAPLLYVSPAQINFQVPVEAALGDAVLDLRLNGSLLATRRIRLVELMPGLFTLSSDGAGPAIVMHASDFRLVTLENPAAPDEILALYATGLGSVTQPVPSGEAAPLAPDPLPATRFIYVDSDSRSQQILYAGLAPTLVGVYQINFVFNPTPGPGPKDLSVSGSNHVTVFAR